MSHELRTPLNSLLILASSCSPTTRRATSTQAGRVRAHDPRAGSDLLSLINDILDLSKIESGTMAIDVDELELAEPAGLRRAQLPADGQSKGRVRGRRDRRRGAAVIYTDPRRLQQVLKNLLSNAFKFTERGGVASIEAAAEGWSPDHESSTTPTRCWPSR
jgi:signal transduction histidine kinase